MQKRRNTAIAERGSLIWGGVQRIKKEKYGHCGKGVADLVWGAKKGEKRSLRLLLEKRVAILGWGAKKGKIPHSFPEKRLRTLFNLGFLIGVR